MVGSGEPVVIKWTANDDQYSPIIGSSCDITLIETPTVNYDEFFDGDEREYLVKVFISIQMLGLQFGTQHKLIGMMLILIGMRQVLLNSLTGQDLL